MLRKVYEVVIERDLAEILLVTKILSFEQYLVGISPDQHTRFLA